MNGEGMHACMHVGLGFVEPKRREGGAEYLFNAYDYLSFYSY